MFEDLYDAFNEFAVFGGSSDSGEQMTVTASAYLRSAGESDENKHADFIH